MWRSFCCISVPSADLRLGCPASSADCTPCKSSRWICPPYGNVWNFPSLSDLKGGEPIPPQPKEGCELRLRNVSFRYPDAAQDTLTHVNLTFHSGEKLAVVGLNGAGKTTLIKLMCGFLDPTEGQVLLDGKDIRTFNRADYYTLFSALFQDFSLLAGTVATNVAQDSENIHMERVKVCVEKAGLRRKIESLKDGYETYLNREVFENAILLSGGETQRLMLARALYKDAPSIILDEPTAALDPIAEAEIYEKFDSIAGDKTAIYISHRLSSCKFCDEIAVFHEGAVIQQGTHAELAADESGKYYELWHSQAQYYTKSHESI